MKAGDRILGHLRLDRLLERGTDTMLFLADDESRGELVLLVFAASPAALDACLARRDAGTLRARTTFESWHVAEVSLEERHLHALAQEFLEAYATTDASMPAASQAIPLLAEESSFAGRYRIRGLLGRGGMGEVYCAYDTTLERAVALKLVRMAGSEDVAGRASSKRRLLHEARVVSVLDHPHIVAIHDAGEAQELPYLVLELCDGGNLRKAMASGSTLEQKLEWLTQIAEALALAHEHGIVHRDVKPENVLLTADGDAKVADFGIAKALEPDPVTGAAFGTTTGTKTTGLVGTPRYMAPEQLLGGNVDARADQFAWALLGYELLTGTHPRARDISAGEQEIPRELRPVFARAMSAEPDARYRDFRALLAHLRARQRARWWPWRAMMAALVALALFYVSLAQTKPQGPHREAPEPMPAAATEVTADVPAPNPAALVPFHAGVQLWRDMSHRQARARFEEAANIDSSFARAHLYYVLIMPWDKATVLPHYRSALDHRAALSDADSKALDAIGPWMREPSDIAESERRLTQVLESTRSFFVASALSNARFRLDRPRDALEVVPWVDDLDKSPAFESEMASWVALDEHRHDDAKRALADCIEKSPGATSCLFTLSNIQLSDGECAEAEATSRQWAAAWPDAPFTQRSLANAIYGRTRSVESTRAALDQERPFVSEKERPIRAAADATYLDIAAGELERARRDLDEWERLAASSSDAFVQGTLASLRLALEYELSPPERVNAMTKRHLARSTAWTSNAWQLDAYHCDNECESILGETYFLGGDLTRARHHLQRAARGCFLTSPFHSLRARQLLGRTYELLGRPSDACDTYRQILTEWPHAQASRTVRHAASRVAALACKP